MGIFNWIGISKSTKEAESKSLDLPALPSNVLSSNYITNGIPVWRDLTTLSFLLNCYHTNCVVNSIVNIKAEAFANMRLFVKDLKTDELTPLNKYDADSGMLNDLLSKPNPLQFTKEWLRQLKVNYEVFGNSYSYATIPKGGYAFNYENMTSIKNLPSYCVTPVLTNKWLEATEIKDIIIRYDLSLNGGTTKIDTERVFHLNTPNIKMDQNFTQGTSKLVALRDPISNIDVAFESRNVLGTERGAHGLISPKKGSEELGSVPFTNEEKIEVQASFSEYGSLRGQYQQIISKQPLEYTKMAMSPKDLGLFEEVSLSAIAVSHGLGVPVDVVKYWIQTGTLGTDSNVSQKKLYDDTIIPESQDFAIGLNSFLKTKERGIEIVCSYDHLQVFQIDRKREAETDKITTKTAESNFMKGLITYGQYAVSAKVELADMSLENKRVWDLDDRQLNAIKGKTQ